MSVKYQDDILMWANEQARLIRAGRFGLLDMEHIAEEIADVKSDATGSLVGLINMYFFYFYQIEC